MNDEKTNSDIPTQAVGMKLNGTMTKQGADNAGWWIAFGIFVLLVCTGLAIASKALLPNGLPTAQPITPTDKNV